MILSMGLSTFCGKGVGVDVCLEMLSVVISGVNIDG